MERQSRSIPADAVHALAALAAGILLYFASARVEVEASLGLAGSVLLEEALKTGVILGFAILSGRRAAAPPVPARKAGIGLPEEAQGLAWGIAAIVAFATAENLAYFAAFPGRGILLRLLWSEPVHLVAGLAEAEAVWLFLRVARAKAGPAAALGCACLLASALLWHLGFNALADGPLPALERAGDEAGLAWRSAIAGAFLANLAAIAALGYRFIHRVIVGGFLYGSK